MGTLHVATFLCFAAALAIGVVMVGCGAGPYRGGTHSGEASGDAKDEMRMPWVPQSMGYLRTWLILGEFPNPPHEGAKVYDHTPPCVGLDTDYLKENGGEAAIRPVAGMTHQRPDGSVAEWKTVTSPADIVDFLAALKGRPGENVVAYAWTTIDAPAARQAMLAVGSDDGCRIWLNGKVVHNILAGRGTVPDNDLVPVTLKAGENTLLVKVEQGTGGWSFCLRVLTPEQAATVHGGQISPALLETQGAGMLAIRTDTTWSAPGAAGAAVKVDVLMPGGRIVATQQAARGEVVSFPTADWPDGPYEVCCSTTTPLGRRDFKHFPWYKGDALVAARRLVATAEAVKTDADMPDTMVLLMLADLVRDRVGGDIDKPVGVSWQRLHSALMEYEELKLGASGDGAKSATTTAAKAGPYGGVRPYGFVRLAYRDPIDDSPQFCCAYLPPDYDPARPWPLVVGLHGYNPENPIYVRWGGLSPEDRHSPLADRYNAIVIEPHGRGNTGYQGLGELDVLRCVELARQRFNVDPDRIYLMGYSMGGGGTWHVGTRHTDLFAAIAPVYGGWDYHVDLSAERLASLTPRDRLEMDSGSSFRNAESLLNTPIFINHGDSDELVNVEHSRYAVRMLQRWGYDVRYWEHPGKGHGALEQEDVMMEWLLAHPRQAHPMKVRLRSADLAGARANWMQVTAREDPVGFIVAEAEIVGPNRLRLDSENAAEVVLAPSGPMIDTAKPLTVFWNGADMRTATPAADGRVTLQASGYAPGKIRKKPGLEGPAGDVINTPFALVVGTISSDPLMREACARMADSAVRMWENWQKVRPRIFKDTDITPADKARYSLILFGGPDSNQVTRELAVQPTPPADAGPAASTPPAAAAREGALPLAISGDTVTIDGRSFKAPDAAVLMIYPNPLNAERYVLVKAATSGKGMLLADRLPDDVDFAIVDGRIPDRDAGRPERQVFIASGHFDAAWRLRINYLDVGSPAVRAKCPVRKAPDWLSTDMPGPTLYLAEVLAAMTEGTFVNMQRDLAWSGNPMRLGGRTHDRGIAVETSHEASGAEWNLAGGWQRLRATIGIEVDHPEKLEQKHKDNTLVRFIVRGDGKELYRSEPFRWNDGPREINVDVRGVKRLRLEVTNDTTWFSAASSVDWADLRLER